MTTIGAGGAAPECCHSLMACLRRRFLKRTRFRVVCLLLGKRAPFVKPRSLTFAPCQWLADANADMSRGMTSPQARSVVKVRGVH